MGDLTYFPPFIYPLINNPAYTNPIPENIIAALPIPSTSPVIQDIRIAKPSVVKQNFIIFLLILMPPCIISLNPVVNLFLYKDYLLIMDDITPNY